MKNRSIPIKNYFDTLKYHFIETYSFNRGPEFESQFIGNNLYVTGLSPVLGMDKRLNDTAVKISEIRTGTYEYDTLNKIVNRQFVSKMEWMCAPFYRDALVFRSKDNEIIESLNICFECGDMRDITGNYIEADEKVYNELKSLLKSFGHNIQNDEYIQLTERVKELRRQR